MRNALVELIGKESVEQFLVPDEVIRHFVVTVDNLPDLQVAERIRPVKTTPGEFTVGGTEELPVLDDTNYQRYAAFVKRDAQYLLRTLHPDHDDRAIAPEVFLARMRAHFATRVVYRGLEVLGSTPPDETGIATVTFRVSVSVKGKDSSFTERSLFARDASGWRYLVGTTE